VGEVHFIVLVRHELVLEAQGEVSIRTFSSSVVIIKEGIIVILVGLHLLASLHVVVDLAMDVILLVAYFIAPFEPADSLFFELALGPDEGLHSYLIETRRFCQIQDIELDPVGLLVGSQGDIFVNYLEVVPLRMAFRVQIIL